VTGEPISVYRSVDGTSYIFTTPKTGAAAGDVLEWTLTNLNHQGMTYDLRGILEVTNTGQVQVGDVNDAYEYAYRVGDTIYGTQNHGGETLLGFALYVDGVQVSLGNNQSATGTHIRLVQNTRLGDGALPNLASITRQYHFTSQGLDLELNTTWNTSVTLAAAYQAMFSVVDANNVSTMGYVEYYSAPFSLTADDGSVKGVTQSLKAYEWNNANPRVVTLEITSPDGYLSSYNMFIQDSSQDNKMYFLRHPLGGSYTVDVGEAWHVTNRYRVFNGSHP
jgi:hypothetical protein